MSYPVNSGASDPVGFEFWEFVCCTKCRMPFALENGSATVPFWLTECGHIICNNHLSPNRSCCQCGAQNIQVVPLSREMDAPMSDWFQSIPSTLDSLAYAVKFQQEAMASQIRYHKLRHQQLRQLVERLKQEIAELKKSQNGQFEYQTEAIGDSARYDFNHNGKRMASIQLFDDGNKRPRTHSSPRSISTPVGPHRLTLLPGQQLHTLSSHEQQRHTQHPQFTDQLNGGQDYAHYTDNPSERRLPSSQRPNHQQSKPSSSRVLNQYAYAPPETDSRSHAPLLTHSQTAPRMFQRQNDYSNLKPGQSSSEFPKPLTSRFKPATSNLPHPPYNASKESSGRQHAAMGPPPTPQRFRNQEQVNIPQNRAQINTASALAGHTSDIASAAGSSSRRFFPEKTNNHPIGAPQTRGISRTTAGLSNANTSGQRTPFISNLGQHTGLD